ncbi:hypothetical protein WSM22_06710 [Cytophagales bacterium WSM2-2]|nr:hypothetical protein WSM22_06710 [Cytophagales bacterium WSM2-2]
MKPKFTLIIAFAMAANCIQAQCDPELYEKLSETFPQFMLLKRFPVTVKKIEGVPFSLEYTYVLTAKTKYGFYLEHSLASEGKVKMRLQDANGVDWTQSLRPSEVGEGKMMILECPTTSVYHIFLYANQSFNGCAVLQLSYLTKKQQPCDLDLLQKLENSIDKSKSIVRQFISLSQEFQYSYVFTKDADYQIYVERVDGKKDGIKFSFLNSEREPITQRMIKKESDRGLKYVFNCKTTGIYYINASVEGEKPCAVVQISNVESK